jgi:hypothetical protein
LDIRNGILLVNGQLNIDGGALAQVHNGGSTDVAERLLQKINSGTVPSGPKGARETLLEETRKYDGIYQNLTPAEQEQADKDFLDEKVQMFAANKGGYRLFFEANARNFDRQFVKDMGQPLDQYEIGGKRVFENMSTADKQRLQQQLLKYSRAGQYRPELFNAAVKLANERGYESVRDLASYIGILEYESRTTSGVLQKDTVKDARQKIDNFLNDVTNGTINGPLETIQANIDQLMPEVERSMEANQNRLG